jgi:hypothetical protein
MKPHWKYIANNINHYIPVPGMYVHFQNIWHICNAILLRRPVRAHPPYHNNRCSSAGLVLLELDCQDHLQPHQVQLHLWARQCWTLDKLSKIAIHWGMHSAMFQPTT